MPNMDRRQLGSTDEIIGRTVKDAIVAGCMGAISFTDGSFIVIEAERDYEDGVAIGVDRYPAEPDINLVKIGVFTRDELTEQHKQYQLADEQRDRMQYERLRKRFEAEEE